LTGFNGSIVSWYENGRAIPGAERLVMLLRLAKTDRQRRAILAALEQRGISPSDLAGPAMAISIQRPAGEVHV